MVWRLFGKKRESENVAAGISTDVSLARVYRRILTPIDMRHAEKSGKAIGVASELAKSLGADYAMLTVTYPLGTHLTDDPESLESRFNGFVAEMSKKTGVKIKPVFRSHESASAVITEVSKEEDIDLIVMASHDPRITDHIFNSNASEVMLHASCSVMVVR